MFDRSSSRLSLLISFPSISIMPLDASRIRKRPSIMVLLPLPVRPTIPIFSPGWIVKLRCFKTSSLSGLYLRQKDLKTISPFGKI